MSGVEELNLNPTQIFNKVARIKCCLLILYKYRRDRESHHVDVGGVALH